MFYILWYNIVYTDPFYSMLYSVQYYGIYILQYFGFAMHFLNSSDLTGMMVIRENLSTKTHGCTLTKSQFNFDATYC